MGGELPRTFLQGLLSGLGHPVIGLDHLAAIVGVGILVALAGRGVVPVLAFTAAMIAGVAIHLVKIDIPASELLVGLSTLAIGGLVILRQSMRAPVGGPRCSPSPACSTAMRWANRSSARSPRRCWPILPAC